MRLGGVLAMLAFASMMGGMNSMYIGSNAPPPKSYRPSNTQRKRRKLLRSNPHLLRSKKYRKYKK